MNKKLVAISILSFQILSISSGLLVAKADGPSPEAILLSRVLMLDGAKLEQAQLQRELIQAVETYNQTADLDHRENRFADAMVSLGVYSKADAQKLVSSIEVHDSGSDAEQELTQLMAENPARGAQFSACDNLKLGTDFLIAGGAAAALVGMYQFWGNSAKEGQPADQPGITMSKEVGFSGLGVMVAAIVARVFEENNCAASTN